MNLRSNWRQFSVIGTLLFLLTLTAAAALYGKGSIAAGEIFHILCGRGGDPSAVIIIEELRLPRLAAAILCGGALGIAGAVLQSVLRNPLAAPDLLGISAGGGCAGLLIILWLPGLLPYLGAAVFVGAMTVTLLIYFIAWKQNFSPSRLILAGVAAGALFGTLSTLMMVLASDRFSGTFNFLLGGFSGISKRELLTFSPVFLLTVLSAALLARRIDILTLGDSSAAALGVPAARTRIAALSVAALGSAGAAGCAGLLGFAGLIAPHTVRLLGKSGTMKFMLPASALAGAELVLLGDWLGQILLPEPMELPAGIFLAGSGAVFFIFLLFTSRSGEL